MGTHKVNKDKENYDLGKQRLGRENLDERRDDSAYNEQGKRSEAVARRQEPQKDQDEQPE